MRKCRCTDLRHIRQDSALHEKKKSRPKNALHWRPIIRHRRRDQKSVVRLCGKLLARKMPFSCPHTPGGKPAALRHPTRDKTADTSYLLLFVNFYTFVSSPEFPHRQSF